MGDCGDRGGLKVVDSLNENDLTRDEMGWEWREGVGLKLSVLKLEICSNDNLQYRSLLVVILTLQLSFAVHLRFNFLDNICIDMALLLKWLINKVLGHH